MITRSYDVIVAGFRPGGLLAGALLAKRGLRVLAINQDGRGPVKVGKYTFPSHRYPFISFDDKDMLGGAIDELTVHPSERKAIEPSRPSYQVLIPGHRVDVYPDDRLNAELTREFPSDDVMLEAFYSRIRDEAGVFLEAWEHKRATTPKPTMFQKMGMGNLMGLKEKALFSGSMPTLGEVLEDMGAPHTVRTFIYAQLLAFGYVMEPENLSMPIAAQILSSARGGLFGDAERAEPLVSLLSNRMKTLQSDVEPDEQLMRLEFGWNRLQEVTFRGYDQKFSCEFLIWNAPYHELLNLLPEGVRKKGYDTRIPLAPYERYSIHLVLDDFVLPVGLHEHAIIVGDLDAPLTEGNLVFMSTSPDGAEQFAPAGTRAITATTVVPVTDALRTREARREVAVRMLTNIKHIVPYMEQYVRTLHVPMPAEDDVQVEGVYDTRVMERSYPGDVGPGTRLPHWNVFHVGRESYPLMGFDGEIGAGQMVADAVMAARKGRNS